MSERGISTAIRDGRLSRLRRGWYAEAEFWRRARPEDRHLAALIAAHRDAPGSPVFSHRSAATLHDLPVWSRWAAGSTQDADARVAHTTVPGSARGSFGPRTVRHRDALAETEVQAVGELRCTTPDRTIFDLARSEPFPIALACADALLRREVRVGRSVDAQRWQNWRDRMLARAEAHPRAHGMRAVRALAALADPRSDSPLESISRLRLLQVGIDVDLQVPVPGEGGSTYYLDFRFRGMDVFGECDGKAKYLDPSLRGGRTADEVVHAEKRRHDWISGTQRLTGVRWGATDTVTAARFATRLSSFGIPMPGRATLAYGPAIAAFLDCLPD